MNQRWRETNPRYFQQERFRAAARERTPVWQANHPDRARALSVAVKQRRRARERDAQVADGDFALVRSFLSVDPCSYCDSPATTIDHIVALSAGGEHAPSNWTGACRSCNSRKSAQPLLLWLCQRPQTGH